MGEAPWDPREGVRQKCSCHPETEDAHPSTVRICKYEGKEEMSVSFLCRDEKKGSGTSVSAHEGTHDAVSEDMSTSGIPGGGMFSLPRRYARADFIIPLLVSCFALRDMDAFFFLDLVGAFSCVSRRGVGEEDRELPGTCRLSMDVDAEGPGTVLGKVSKVGLAMTGEHCEMTMSGTTGSGDRVRAAISGGRAGASPSRSLGAMLPSELSLKNLSLRTGDLMRRLGGKAIREWVLLLLVATRGVSEYSRVGGW